jgi:prepilin-type processing-associated H-X9-DG protein
VLFCPGADQPLDADAELAKVGKTQAQGSYYYRHAGNTTLIDPGGIAPPLPQNIRLANLGDNRQGVPIRALVVDTVFLTMPEFSTFGVTNKTNHQGRWVNVVFADGHVTSRANDDHRYTVNLTNYSDLHSAFSTILGVFEKADAEP